MPSASSTRAATVVALGVAAGGLLTATASPADAAETTASSTVIVREGDVRNDDLYAAALRVIVSGTIDADLIAFAAEEIVIDGTVTGSVLALAPSVTVEGSIGGSLRVIASSLRVDGDVARDVVASSWRVRLGQDSAVGGDVVAWAMDMSARGEVGADLEGTQRTLRLGGAVGRNVDVSVSSLAVVDDLEVGGDFGYRSESEAAGLEQAAVEGIVVRRTPLAPNVRARAFALFGRFLAFVVMTATALTVAYAWPRRAAAAVERVGVSPLRAWGYGAVLMGSPLLVAATGALALALAPPTAGLPLLGMLVPVVLALLGLVGALSLVAGLPAVGWLGGALFKRLGLQGAVLTGSLLAGLIWLLPLVGWLVPVVALPLGLGAWILALRTGGPDAIEV